MHTFMYCIINIYIIYINNIPRYNYIYIYIYIHMVHGTCTVLLIVTYMYSVFTCVFFDTKVVMYVRIHRQRLYRITGTRILTIVR